MLATKEDFIYIVEKYSEVRYSNRGLFFKKRNPIDPRSIPDVVDYFDDGHIQGFFVIKGDRKFIFILGSNELADWIYNFQFRLMITPYKEVGVRDEIKVHKGFYKSYLRVREFIHDKIRDDKKVIVYGQSLGAAVATLAALDIQYNFPDKEVACVTTGSPRVGNEEFVLSYNKRIPDTTRFVYGNDIVSNVPQKWLGYRHVHGLVHLGPEGGCQSISDHMMASYIPAIAGKYGS